MQESYYEMNSTHHKNNIEKNLLLSSDDNLSKKIVNYFKKKEIEELKYWLRKEREREREREREPCDATKFFCLICNKSFLYTKKRIYSHAISKLHIDRCKCSSIEISKSNEDFKFQISKSFFIFEEHRKEAEIRYAAHSPITIFL